MSTKQLDTAEKVLEDFKKSEAHYQNHWIWKKLNCTPKQFYEAVNQHVASLNIPKEKWDAMMAQAKDAQRVRLKEKQTSFKKMNPLLARAIQI